MNTFLYLVNFYRKITQAALKQEFKERLKESPVYLLEHVLGLVGPIKIVNGNIVVKDSFYE